MQQYGSKYLTCRSPCATLGMRSIGQNSTFSERGHVAHHIKGIHEIQQHGSKHFAHRTSPKPLTLELESKGQNSTFSEHGQIKGNHGLSNIVANLLPADTPPPPPHPGDGAKRSKVNFFRTWSCCLSNYMESRNAATWS